MPLVAVGIDLLREPSWLGLPKSEFAVQRVGVSCTKKPTPYRPQLRKTCDDANQPNAQSFTSVLLQDEHVSEER